MAYGRGRSKETTERRAAEIGRVGLGAAHPLAEIRAEVRSLCEEMVIAVWVEDPGAKPLGGKEMDAALLPVQSRSGLNSVWAEAARMTVRAAVPEQHRRRSGHLYGTLLNLDGVKTCGKTGREVFVNVPEALTGDPGRLRALASLIKGMSDADRSALASRVFRGLPTRLDAFGTAVIRAAVERSREKFPCPSWSRRADEGSIRIPLDHRSVLGGKAAGRLPDRLAAFTGAIRAGAAHEDLFRISAPRPRGEPIPLPVRLSASAHARHAGAEASALCVEIGPEDAVVKLILAKARPLTPDRVRYVLGRDYGYRNTVALSLIDLGREWSLAEARRVIESVSTREEARAHLTANADPAGARVLETRVIPAEGFRRRIGEIDAHIDKLRSEIDLSYARLTRLKAAYLAGAGQGPDELVPEDRPAGLSKETARQHARFWRLFGRIAALKSKRRGLYRVADGVKRSWLGHVANVETRMAARYGAAVISEDLTVEAVEREDPQYKGRAFNRMINNGARGLYARIADAKAAWAGTPALRVPSFHTSTADTRHGVVDKKQRRGDVFTARADGRVEHADAHAAYTIGVWPFLAPKRNSVRNANPPLQDASAA